MIPIPIFQSIFLLAENLPVISHVTLGTYFPEQIGRLKRTPSKSSTIEKLYLILLNTIFFFSLFFEVHVFLNNNFGTEFNSRTEKKKKISGNISIKNYLVVTKKLNFSNLD